MKNIKDFTDFSTDYKQDKFGGRLPLVEILIMIFGVFLIFLALKLIIKF